MIEKMDMKSMDITEENVKKIQALFPNAVTEVIDGYTKDEKGQDKPIYKLKIDFDVLQQELSANLIEDKQERYQMTWPDKSKAKVLANSRITSTLRPDKEKSVNFDNTQNLYIEGDNLDVLKLLRETYLGKVKMIYIDPPYNTGNDFVYNDDFSQSSEEYMETSGQYDEEGNRLVKNLESNGRFHTDWLNMIYPRLKVAKDLLSDDGVIFISIDDNEVENLKKICNEIYGEDNFVASIVWKRKRGRDNSARWFSKAHEYLVIYARNKDAFDTNYLELDEETKTAYKNPDNDPRGDYRMLGCWARGTQGGVKYDFTTKDGQYFSERLWLFSKENLRKLDQEDKLIIRGDNIYRKMFIYENKGKIPETLWDNVSNAANAADEIKKLFSDIVFDTPKPIPYITEMLKIATNKDSLILDFFSGSATTAHAVMQLNAEDGGNRKFIMVQLPEECDEKSEAYKAGYKTICEIGEERIRRAGKKIKEDRLIKIDADKSKLMQRTLLDDGTFDDKYALKITPAPDDEVLDKLDTGFRVLKLDSSNMQDVYYNPNAMSQSLLDETIDNVKTDRTPLDLLFQVMLDLGVELSAKIEEKQVNGKTYFVVNGNDLIACFDEDIDNDVITEIAKQQPLYAVFKSRSFATDSASINNEQLFKTYSPSTVIKVI